ncbi:hypothetical protein PTTG_30619 [Puccinia triticina 1-1 BBBD Race 1]|uniref:Helicase C-terminal domain-containing protein n=1 Tax=Puccinia triticina (isolate 1-1 / race 1 (BBBD)) TaxID=630390 RepID=A0A180FY29_PUCT1|nr:hypothetical protein PTTG_30619 [Puccinia triticina 1-1 BBBD Race 1]
MGRAEFFRQLTMLRQFCNHPVFARAVLPIQPTWRWQDSGKIVHLIDSLLVFFSGGREIERPKAVVFSSFVGFLEIVERALQESHIGFTWLTGNLKVQKRDENLNTFRGNSNCKVLLASLQAAGVGIDLRCAQNEPSWNPAMEFQAIDRLYRLGQRNSVWVYRYYIQGSLEMNIFQVQRRKCELAL